MVKKFIYVLIDPRNDEKKYVGMSKDPYKRLAEHIYDIKREKTKKSNWIKKLINLNLKPKLEILIETSELDVEYWESHFIKKFKEEGYILLNYDNNGIGTKGGVNLETILEIKKQRCKKIKQYDLNGNLVNEFKSLREAEKITTINHGNISRCCNGIFKHTGGFIFKTDDFNGEIKKVDNPNGLKKVVIEIDLTGNEIEVFNSISDAAKKTKIDAANISKVCNGILKKTNNRYFKFKENE